MRDNKLKKAARIYHSEGLIPTLNRSVNFLIRRSGEQYNERIRPNLPHSASHGQFNGVKVSSPKLRLFDRVVPWSTDAKISSYKQTNVDAVLEQVESGDHVVIVGGGRGVTTVHAARAVGSRGHVTVYEADRVRASGLEKTLETHGVRDRCTVTVAIVGAGYLASNTEDTDQVSPQELPSCDVLEMDCEGAEYEILSNLCDYPRTVIVETHFKKDYAPYDSEDEIAKVLTDAGYSLDRRQGRWVNSLLVGT